MKNATFYVMESETTSDGLSAIEALVCFLAESRWRDGKRILIAWMKPCGSARQTPLCRIISPVKARAMAHRLSFPGRNDVVVRRVTC